MWCVCVVLCLLGFGVDCSANRELIPLDAPDNLTLIDFDDRDVVIRWDPVDPESVRGTFRGYLVRVWNNALSQVYAIPPDVTRTAIQFFPYSKNFITVAVRNDKYVGPRSIAIGFDAPQTEPNMPFLFEHYQLGSKSFLLQWNQPTQPNGILLGFNIYCSEMTGSTVNEKTTIKYFISGADNLQAKLTGLKEGTKYFVQIGAVNCAGESEHKSMEVELQPHTTYPPAMPSFKYKIDYNITNKDVITKQKCSGFTSTDIYDTSKLEEESNDFYLSNQGANSKSATVPPRPSEFVQTNCLVNTLIKWVPEIDNHPGESFYVKYRIKGEAEFLNSTLETEEDYTILVNFNACVNYEIILVAVDGEYETESEQQETPAMMFTLYPKY